VSLQLCQAEYLTLDIQVLRLVVMAGRDMAREFRSRFAGYLESLGKHRGAVQALAKELGVTRQAIYLWKKSIPKPETLRKLLNRNSLGFSSSEQERLLNLVRAGAGLPGQMSLPFEVELPDGETIVRIEASRAHPGQVAITMRRKLAS
jgi:hypothetical protein